MNFVTASEFHQLMAAFSPFEHPPVIAVAVSGGPDSLALTLLAHEWAASQNGKIIAVTVDHRLRDDSAQEAIQVNRWLTERGVEHHILIWERADDKPLQTGIQAEAREARYRLLGRWCQEQGIKHLLTAHHAQDQLETFMIRLTKGSGLKGLTSTQGTALTSYGRILRPLLTIDPHRLKTTLKHFNQPFLLDPSNEREDFTRIRWRQLLPQLASEGLNAESLQKTLDRLGHSQRLIDQHISRLIEQHVTFTPYGYAIVDHRVLNESFEALEEILKRLFACIGTHGYPVRRQALHRAIARLKEGDSFTLGGCQIICKPKAWWVVREFEAIGEDIMVSQPGTYLWDNRFFVEVDQEVPCRISALGEVGIQQLEDSVKKGLKMVPHVVLKTLPALWKGEPSLPRLRQIPKARQQAIKV